MSGSEPDKLRALLAAALPSHIVGCERYWFFLFAFVSQSTRSYGLYQPTPTNPDSQNKKDLFLLYI